MSHFLPCSRSLSWLWLVFWATQSLVLTAPLRAGDVDQLPADAWRLPSDSGLVPGKLFESLQVAYDGPSRAYVPWRYRSYFNFDLLFGAARKTIRADKRVSAFRNFLISASAESFSFFVFDTVQSDGTNKLKSRI